MKPHLKEDYDFLIRDRSSGSYIVGTRLVKRDLLQCDITRQGNKILPQPFHFTSLVTTSVRGSIERFSGGSRVDEYRGPFGVTPSYDPISQREIENTYNAAIEDVNEQLRGNVDISTDLGQIAQTKRMLNASEQVADKIDPIIRTLRKKVGRKVNLLRLTMGSVSSAYLEWKYGIKPLLQTIHDAATVLHNMADSGTFSTRGRAKLRFEKKFSQVVPFEGIPVPVTSETTYDYRCEVKIWLRLGDYHPTAVQLSSMNPVSIAWELMPWSFVIDWFVNMSGYMRDLETAIAYGSYFHMGYTTTSSKVSVAMRPTNSAFTNGGLAVKPHLQTANLQLKSMLRIVLTEYPMPNRPSVNMDLGSGSLLSIAALLGSKFRQ